MRKRFLILGVIAILITGAVFASGQSEPQAAAEAAKPVPMKYVVPGNDYPETPVALAAVNKQLQQDGINIEVSVQFIPWDAWQNKVNVMLSAGESFDLLHVMENWIPSSTYAGRGALVPLDDLIAKYGADLKPRFSEFHWNSMKVGGKTYSVPAYWRNATGIMADGSGKITVREDKLKEYGLKAPATAKELMDTALALQKAWGEKTYIWEHNVNRTPSWLHRTYSSWPFTLEIENPIIMVDSKGSVNSWLESEEFKQDCTWFREAYNKGIIHPDVLSIPKDVQDNELGQGRYLFALGTKEFNMGPKKHDANYMPSVYVLNPEKPTPVSLPVLNSNAIPITSKNPEVGIKFLNWLYKNEKNHDLFIYGVLGKHYTNLGNSRIEPVRDANNRPVYEHPGWMIQYYKWAKFTPETLATEIELVRADDPNPLLAPNAGFAFNTEAVSAEMANVQAEYKAGMLPIRWGVVAFDAYFPQALQKMKAAGLDKVVAEYKKQFEAYKAKK